MLNMKKGFLPLLACLIFWLAPTTQVQASHEMGVDVYYTCLGCSPNGQCTIRVTLKLYADCSGAFTIIYQNPQFLVSFPTTAGGCPAPTPITNWIRQTSILPNGQPCPPSVTPCPVTPVCTSIQDQCANPSSPLPGVVEAIWERDYVINTNCAYTSAYENCCRNPGILNAPTASSSHVRLDINPGAWPIGPPPVVAGSGAPQTRGCLNSSPRFNIAPSPYFCLNNPVSFNQGATDPDGDSLVYRFGTCYDGGGLPVTYAPGYAPGTGTSSTALPSLPVMTIDPVTGNIQLNPIALGKYIVCIFVDEFRNGVKIGTIMRDLQFTIIDCNVLNPNPIPNFPPLMDSVNTRNVFGTFSLTDTVCAGNPITYRLRAVDPNLDQILGITFVNSIPGSTIVQGTPANPVYTTFNWPNPIASPNPYQFVISMKDNGCPLNLSQQFAVRIVVLPNVVVNENVTANCNLATFNMNVTVGNPPYTVVWDGNGGLSQDPNHIQNPTGNSATLTHLYPGPGSYPYTLRVSSPGGCDTTISGVVVINPDAVQINAGADATICSEVPYTIGEAPLPGYSYTWSPSTNLDNATASSPTVTRINNTNKADTLIYAVRVSNGICIAVDTVKVVVLPGPIASITGSTNLCEGDIITLAGPPNQFGYIWSTGETSRVIQFPAPGFSIGVTLTTVAASGCLSQTITRVVNVTPRPRTIIVGNPYSCEGDTIVLTASDGNLFFWSNGSSLPVQRFDPPYNNDLVWVVAYNGNCSGDTVFRTLTAVQNPVTGIQLVSPDSVQCNRSNSFDFIGTGTLDSDIDYEWRFGSGAVPAASSLYDPTPVSYFSSGTKYITLFARNRVTGCISDTAKYEVIVLETPVPATTQPAPQCFNEHNFSISYTGSNANQWVWNFGPNALIPGRVGRDITGIYYNQAGVQPFTVYAYLVDPSGTICMDSLTGSITVLPSPPPPIGTTDTICQGSAAQISAVAQTGGTLYWIEPTNQTVLATGPIFVTPPLYQDQTFFVREVNSDNCPSYFTVITVKVDTLPIIAPDAVDDTLELPLAVAQFHANPVSSNISFFLWDLGDGTTSTDPNPVHQYTNPGTYTISLTVRDAQDCINSTVRQNYIVVKEPLEINIPSAFSPNRDGRNDIFFIDSKLIESTEFAVFDRWGTEVYRTNNVGFRWDGSISNKGSDMVQEGVYTYYMKGNYYNGKGFTRTGTITVIR
jgi:gliding motility-associated-like protein